MPNNNLINPLKLRILERPVSSRAGFDFSSSYIALLRTQNLQLSMNHCCE